jgi:hypothetical protein
MKYTFSVKDFPEKTDLYGKYISDTPIRAAKKAFSKLIKLMNMEHNIVNNSSKFLIFTIINNQNNKEYKYIGKRIKLDKPSTIIKNGKTIIYQYSNVIGKYDEKLELNN